MPKAKLDWSAQNNHSFNPDGSAALQHAVKSTQKLAPGQANTQSVPDIFQALA